LRFWINTVFRVLAWGGIIIIVSCSGPSLESGREFRMPIAAEPPTLDWTLATDSVSVTLLTNLMEGLTQYNASLEPQPAVAKRWKFSDDGRTITYYLRDDVFWSDGKRVTARDFEFSWKRLLNPATAAQYAYFLFDIENAYEYNAGQLTDPGQVGVRALSPLVLEVRLKRPVIYFPSITTFMVTYPQREDIVTRYGDRWTDPDKIVTNGAFILSQWRHEYKLELLANPRHFEGRPAIDRVTFYVVPEKTTALTLYETGELDRVELPPVAIPHYRNSREYVQIPQLRGYYYGFNVHKPPFDDVRVRRAFAHAIDRSRIPVILKGGEIPASSWIPEGMIAHNPDIGLKFDPEKARRLLTEAGYPGGKGLPPVSAVYNTGSINPLVGEFLQAEWKKNLRVEVEIDSQEWKVFLSRLQVDPPQLFRLGWGADFPDPDNFMNLFLSTSGNNHLGFNNPRYDALVQRGPTLADPAKRQALYDEAQRILTEEAAAIIPLFFSAQNLLIKPYVEGLEANAMELLYLKRAAVKRGEPRAAPRA